MSFRVKFKGLDRSIKQLEKEREDKATEEIENHNRTVALFKRPVEDVCREFGRMCGYKVDTREERRSDNQFSRVKERKFYLYLANRDPNKNWKRASTWTNIKVSCEKNGVCIQPDKSDVYARGFRSVIIPYSEFSKEKLAESLETAQKELSGIPVPRREQAEFEIADWRKSVALKGDEYVVLKTDWATNLRSREIFEMESNMFNAKGDFVLTNQRLLFLAHKFVEKSDGTTALSFELLKEFPLEIIKDVTYHNREVTVYTNEGEYGCGEMGVIRSIDWPRGGVDTPTYFFNYFRKKIIEEKEKKATVSMDFSSLKSVIEKGGIVVTALSCPKCNAPMEIPTDGTITVCQHCGSRVIANDIFEKLKTLLS